MALSALRRARPASLLLLVLASGPGCYTPARTSVVERTRGLWAEPALAPLDGGALHLEDALTRAKAQSAEIEARRAQARAARAAAEAAGPAENPELRVGQLRLDRLTHDDPEVEVKLRVKPPRPVESEARRAEADAEARASEADVSQAELAAEGEARAAYYEAAALSEVVAAARAREAVEQRRLALIERAVADGRETQLDLASAKLEREDVAQDRAMFERERARSLARLSARIGAALPDDVALDRLDREAIAALALPDEKRLIELSLSRSPELVRRAAEVDAAEARADRERTGQAPWFSFLELGYDFSRTTVDPEGFTFGAGLTLPIFDTKSAAIEAADAEVEARKRRLDADAAAAKLDVDAARGSLSGAQAELAQRRTLRAAAKTVVDEAERALASGRVDELEKVAAERKLAAIELEEAKSLRRAVAALAELERLTGYRALPR